MGDQITAEGSWPGPLHFNKMTGDSDALLDLRTFAVVTF